MRFQITSVANRCVNDFMQKYGKILEKYHVEYKKEDQIQGKFDYYSNLYDEDYDDNIYVFIKIDTLEELMAFKKEVGGGLVLRDDGDGVELIEIYDGYRE